MTKLLAYLMHYGLSDLNCVQPTNAEIVISGDCRGPNGKLFTVYSWYVGRIWYHRSNQDSNSNFSQSSRHSAI